MISLLGFLDYLTFLNFSANILKYNLRLESVKYIHFFYQRTNDSSIRKVFQRYMINQL